MSTLVVGIDNGLDGAVVALRDGGVAFKCITPAIVGSSGRRKSGRRIYDHFAMANMLRQLRDLDRGLMVFLEKALPMPKNGALASFSTGMGNGLWQGILATLEIPYELTTPQRWQHAIFVGLPKGDTKANARLIAKRLQPSLDWRRTPKCKEAHDGLCDAFCLATYGTRVLGAGITVARSSAVG